MNKAEITIEDHLTTSASPKKLLRKSIHLMGIGYVPYMMWVWIISGVPLAILAKTLHMSEFGFGLLGGLFIYTQVSQLLGSFVIERYGHRKLTVILGGLIHRAIWLLAAILPIFTGSGNWTWITLLILAYFSHLGASFVAPGIISWIADLVPGRLQGRFCGQRMRLGLFASLAVLIIASYILDKAEASSPDSLKLSLILIFMFAAITGTVEYVLYLFVPDPPKKKSESTISLRKIILKPLSDREFVSFLSLYCTMMASAVFMGLYTFLFLLDVIKLSNVSVTILLVMTPNLINALIYPFWGRVTDRVGYKPALTIGAFGYLLYGCWYFWATPANWIGMYIFGMIAFCFTGALDTGTAVLMYSKITGNGKNSNMGSSYPAVTGVTCAVGGVLSAVAAGILASWLGKDWRGSMGGHPMTYHTVLFAVMVAMRIVALFGLVGIKNLSHCSASYTVKVIGEEAVKTIFKAKRFFFTLKPVSGFKAAQ